MELFTVNRYIDDTSTGVANKEDEILQNIWHKVETKKRKKKKTALTETETEIIENLHKKQKHDADHSEDNIKKPKNSANDQKHTIDGGEAPLAATADADADADAENNFQVLGEDVSATKKPIKVDMVLPNWLAQPTLISTTIAKSGAAKGKTDVADNAVENLDYLTPAMRRALKKMNIVNLFPVQSSVIPWIIEAHQKPYPFRPRDICVSSPTGSGKTLAFAVPIVQLLNKCTRGKIRALIVLPVIELALQIYTVFKKLCEKTSLSVILLSKHVAFELEQEKLMLCYQEKYYSKVDIVITTPGRLVDHMYQTKGFSLKYLKFLVIDEADRVMDGVFQNWQYHLSEHVRDTTDKLFFGGTVPLSYNSLLISAATQPHKLLYSATLTQDLEKLKNFGLFQPKLFASAPITFKATDTTTAADNDALDDMGGELVGKYTTPAELTEKYCLTESRLKPLTLYSLIKENNWLKFLCFTNSGDAANRLAFVLTQLCGQNLNIQHLSAALAAKKRTMLLSKFSRGKINGIVCSDALARGIDIPDVDIVISYDPPRHIKTYIHRIGRTARAGRLGTAVTLLDQKELQTFKQILRKADKSITDEITVSSTIEEDHALIYSKALSALRNEIEKNKRAKTLLRERARDAAASVKDTSQMPLMEKLQIQATAHVQQKTEASEKLLDTKMKRNETRIKNKKLKRKNKFKQQKQNNNNANNNNNNKNNYNNDNKKAVKPRKAQKISKMTQNGQN